MFAAPGLATTGPAAPGPAAPVRFAVLGEDRRLLTLTRAAIRLGHQLVWYGETGKLESDFQAISREQRSPIKTRPDTNWERFLDGNLVDLMLANICKQNVTRFPYEIARLLQDIAGGMMVTLPSARDLKSPEVGHYLEKYLKASEASSAENQG